MTRLHAIFGASGCGRGIMPLARAAYPGGPSDQLVFVDDGLAGSIVNGHTIFGFDQFVAAEADEKYIAIAIASPTIRAKLAERCVQHGLSFFSVTAQSAIIMDDVAIGEGALISPFVTFTSNIIVGRHFHANINSYIEHDCVIGDFVTFAPGVQCNGNVDIGDGAYIGAGAIIKQGVPGKPLRIGAGATVGMGAIVLRDVAAGETIVGNPARPIRA